MSINARRQLRSSHPKGSSTFFRKDEALFFHTISLKHYMNFVLLKTVFLITENVSSFPVEAAQVLSVITEFCSQNKEDKALFKISDSDFHALSCAISILHDKYIWNTYINDKGRKVYLIAKGYEFIRLPHSLFRLMRNKILKNDIETAFDIRTFNVPYVEEVKTPKTSFKRIRSAIEGDGRYFPNDVYSSRDFRNDKSRSESFVGSVISYYDRHCSFGTLGNLHSAVSLHIHPDNMVVFDISKFFPTFTLDRIKRLRLFERIYETAIGNTNRFVKRGQNVITSSSSYLRNAEFFYALFGMFSCKGLLPTGACFASDISNLLFFSVDMEIKEGIEKYYEAKFRALAPAELLDMSSVRMPRGLNGTGNPTTTGLFHDFPIDTGTGTNILSGIMGSGAPDWINAQVDRESISPSKLRSFTRGPVYTRYVDDIAISLDLLSIIQTFEFRGIKIDIRKFFMGMDLIKEIEKILNAKEFFIKYDKTKVYSYKMDKKYLGFIYSSTRTRPRTGTESPEQVIRNKNYKSGLPSKQRYDFAKKFYLIDTLPLVERNKLKCFFHYATGLSSKIPPNVFRMQNIFNRQGRLPGYVFMNSRRKDFRHSGKLISLTTAQRKKFRYG